MTRLGAAVTLALIWAVSVGAQSTPGNPPNTRGILGILSTNVNTKHSTVGGRVEVEVTQDVKPGGHILLRTGSHVTGQITQAYAFAKGDSNSKLESQRAASRFRPIS
jgi:hypothetical protein